MKNKNLIAISGKIGSGKDTIGAIINYLMWKNNVEKNQEYTSFLTLQNFIDGRGPYNYKIKKFSDKIKDIVCSLINCTKGQLELEEFKNTELGEEWWIFDETTIKNWLLESYSRKEIDTNPSIFLNNYKNSTKGIIKLTPKKLIQLIKTNGQNIIHENIWINSLFSDYFNPCEFYKNKEQCLCYKGDHDPLTLCETELPNWIITDCTFKNELKAIKNRNGITIRVNRDYVLRNADEDSKNQYESETALDNTEFDYIIDNNGSIENLVEKLQEILIKENII